MLPSESSHHVVRRANHIKEGTRGRVPREQPTPTASHVNEPREIFQMTAFPDDITVSKITTELNQLTDRLLTSNTMVVV